MKPTAAAVLTLLALIAACSRQPEEPKAIPQAAASAPMAPLWEPKRHVNKMTDAVTCALRYRDDLGIWYNEADELVISRYGKGSVKQYRFRIDAENATRFLAPDADNPDVIVLHLAKWGNVDAKRVLLDGRDGLDRVFDYEIDTSDIAGLRSKMFAMCGKPAPDLAEIRRVAIVEAQQAEKNIRAQMRRLGIDQPRP